MFNNQDGHGQNVFTVTRLITAFSFSHSNSSKEMGFLNPKYPLPSESGGAVQLGRDVTPTTLVQIKLVGPSNW